MNSETPDQLSAMPSEPSYSAVSNATSLSTLERAKAADPKAWHRLVELYSPLLIDWCRRTGVRGEDAADVSQEVWTAVSRALVRFAKDDDNATFRGWLWTITRNKLRDFYRKRQHTGAAQAESWLLNEVAAIPDDEPPDSEFDTGGGTVGLIRRALALIREDFEERTWESFWLTTVDALPAADVAARVGTTAQAVYQAKARILRRLRDEIGDVTAYLGSKFRDKSPP